MHACSHKPQMVKPGVCYKVCLVELFSSSSGIGEKCNTNESDEELVLVKVWS